MDNPHIVATLNRLIAHGLDGERALRAGAGRAQAGALREMLLQRADHCRLSVLELQEIVRDFGGEPRAGGTAVARLRRGLVLLRGWLLGHRDAALLADCERLQATAMDRYRQALDAPLPPTVRKVVLRQFEGTQRHQAVARSMRDGARVMQRA
jgi:uncharacterized protein (TIGR02284 family)